MKRTEIDNLWLKILYQCNEVQRRRLAGVKALELGRGGLLRVCELTGMSHHTVIKGIQEVKDEKRNPLPLTRLRKEGGGRKKITDKNPDIKNEIQSILEENTAGDPMSDIKWTNKSVRNIANEINSPKKHIGKDTVASIVKDLGFSLQLNKKSFEGGTSAERDSQFRYINSMALRQINRLTLLVLRGAGRDTANILSA